MPETLLITLGCSWTFGVGCNYQPGMTSKKYHESCQDAEHANRWSWRAVLCQDFNWHNFNLSEGGSSNQRQFRYAETFFSSKGFDILRSRYQRIVVFWGITSTARNEFFSIEKNLPFNFLFNTKGAEPSTSFSKFCLKHTYSHEYEIYRIKRSILHWNRYFQNLGISNYWFDTFNHHDYHDSDVDWFDKSSYLSEEKYKNIAGPDWPTFENFSLRNFENISSELQEEIAARMGDVLPWQISMPARPVYNDSIGNFIGYDLDQRDQLSWLCQKSGIDNKGSGYHKSSWKADTPGIDGLVKIGWLNPYSCHPTKETHRLLAQYFQEKLPELFNK